MFHHHFLGKLKDRRAHLSEAYFPSFGGDQPCYYYSLWTLLIRNEARSKLRYSQPQGISISKSTYPLRSIVSMLHQTSYSAFSITNTNLSQKSTLKFNFGTTSLFYSQNNFNMQFKATATLFTLGTLCAHTLAMPAHPTTRGFKCDFLGLGCPSVSVRAHTAQDCSDKHDWNDFLKRFLISLPLKAQPIAVGKKTYNPGTCVSNYGSSATITGLNAVAFQIEDITKLPDGQVCYVRVFGENDCKGKSNWVGPIDADSTKGCWGSADPDTGLTRTANSFQLMCCNSFEDCVA